ncbi:hypothetical protein BSKO_07316 [Bryopsis sp. KO-2023]|nr:hypothetical protein BSKO_07316 [Bryopsis sp. KO-2023]
MMGPQHVVNASHATVPTSRVESRASMKSASFTNSQQKQQKNSFSEGPMRQGPHAMNGGKRDAFNVTPPYSVQPYVSPPSPWGVPPTNPIQHGAEGGYVGEQVPENGAQCAPPPWCNPQTNYMMPSPSPGNPGVPYGPFSGGPQGPPAYRGVFPVSPSHAPPAAPMRDVSVHMKRFEEKARRTNSMGDDSDRPYSLIKAVEASRKLGQPGPATWFNAHGFPLRSGKPDCKHYISKGWCAYGTMCKFNHPDMGPPSSPMAPHYQVPPPPGHAPQMVSAAWGSSPAPYFWTPWGPQMPPNYMMSPHYYPGMVFRSGSIDSRVSSLSNVNSGESDKASEGGSVRDNCFYGH